jgi:hypothetical protein
MTLILSGMIFSRFCLAIVTGVERKKKDKFSRRLGLCTPASQPRPQH